MAISRSEFRGVTANQDLSTSLIKRDTRPLRYRFRDGVVSNGGPVMIGLGLLVAIWPFIFSFQASDILFILGMLFVAYAMNKVLAYPYRNPADPKRGEDYDEDDGIIFFGNDRINYASSWFNNSDSRTHVLVFGSTGSGKTRFLLGIFYQAVLIGSGAIYVDGKGDNSVFWLAYSMCRRLGRESQLLVLNYLTGTGTSGGNRITNSNNPFSYGSAEQLRSLVVGLMRDSGSSDGMWKGRASAMLGALMNVLVELRDRGEMDLDIGAIREHLPLDKLVQLSLRKDLSAKSVQALRAYLAELPGYTEADALGGEIQQKAYEQHGYLSMQLTEVMADLTETYGHIFAVKHGEIDFKDIVFNRRILFVMLPALEKDPDALAGLGKLVVSGIRSALAPALGNAVSGTKREAVDQKPSNAKVPFFIILDEYGYYSVKGFAVVAAQARSLGVSVIFAGQDYPSFKKGSAEEAESVKANTNIKVFMKLEDPGSTFEIAQKRAGEASVADVTGYDMGMGLGGGFRSQNQAKISKVNVITLRDLTDQRPGEAHVIFGDKVSRIKVFYADPYELPEIKLNEFIQIDSISKQQIDAINGSYEKLEELFEGLASDAEDDDALDIDQGLMTLFSDYAMAKSNGEGNADAAVIAVGMIEVRSRLEDARMDLDIASKKRAAKDALGGADDGQADTGDDGSADDIIDDLEDDVLDDWDDKPDDTGSDESNEVRSGGGGQDNNDNSEPHLQIISDTMDEQSDGDEFSKAAERFTGEFMDLLSQTVIKETVKRAGTEISPRDRSNLAPEKRIREIARDISGDYDEVASEMAEKTMSTLDVSLRYPIMPVPEKMDEEAMNQRLRELLMRVDESSNL